MPCLSTGNGPLPGGFSRFHRFPGENLPGLGTFTPGAATKKPGSLSRTGQPGTVFCFAGDVKSASASPRGRGRPPRRPPSFPAPSARPASGTPTTGRGQLPSSPRARSTWRNSMWDRYTQKEALERNLAAAPQPGASPLDRGQQGENPRRHQADAHAHAPPRTWCSGRRPGGRRAPFPQRRRQGPAPRRGAPHRRRREGTSSSTYPSRQ